MMSFSPLFKSPTARWMVAGSLVLAAVVLMFRGPGDATAQQQGNSVVRPGAEMILSASYINQVIPAAGTSDKIHDVLTFPNTPVFMVRTDEQLSIWERRSNSLVKLMEIPLENTLRKVEVLGDGRTFVLQTDRSVRVYSIDGRLINNTPVTTRR